MEVHEGFHPVCFVGRIPYLVPADITADALVLRRTDSGENDRRLVLLTPEWGKLDAVAKGARKGGSRLAGSSEPVTLGRFTLAVGRQRRFVVQVQPTTSFPGIRSDYDRLVAALAWAEVLDASIPYESPLDGWWELGLAGFYSLEGSEKWLASYAWILSQALDLEGRQPDWLSCVDSGVSSLDGPIWVSAHAGGRISMALRNQYADSFRASPEALIALSRLPTLESAPSNLKRAPEVVRILLEMWQGILNRPLKATQTLVASLQLAEGSE